MNNIFNLFDKLTAILGGIIYFGSSEVVNGKCQFDQTSTSNIQTALFYTVAVTIIISILAATMTFPLEIPIFQRDHYAGVYRTDTYYLSKILQEVKKYENY